MQNHAICFILMAEKLPNYRLISIHIYTLATICCCETFKPKKVNVICYVGEKNNNFEKHVQTYLPGINNL